MRFFRIFRKRHKKASRTSKTSRPRPKTAAALKKAASDIAYLQGQIGTINIALKKHEDQLAHHEERLQEYDKELETLEQKVSSITNFSPTAAQACDPPAAQIDQAQTRPEAALPLAQKFDIDHFSEQERRIISIFFQNKGKRMSYSDVAGLMGKSAHTVKNQMHQIRRKADLFEKMTGPECRNFFKLKDDLRIEKYLNVGQPIVQPMSTPLSTQSSASRQLADLHESADAG